MEKLEKRMEILEKEIDDCIKMMDKHLQSKDYKMVKRCSDIITDKVEQLYAYDLELKKNPY